MSAPSNNPSTVSDFKRQVQERTKVPSWGGKPANLPSGSNTPGTSTPPPPPGKKKKPKSDIVWSQPSDTGTGAQRGTQLAFVLDFLKNSQNPIRLEDLAIRSNVLSLQSDQTLLASFEADPNVLKNPNNGLYSWKRVYQARTPEELLAEIRARGRDGGGLSVKTLKEGFPDVIAHIEALEAKGQVLVTRATKDSLPKHVFWNEITPEQGGSMLDEEFRTLWDELANPVEADLLKSLERDGLQPTTSEILPSKQQQKKKGKKPKVHNRVHKITNTHIEGVDLTKDFVKPGSS